MMRPLAGCLLVATLGVGAPARAQSGLDACTQSSRSQARVGPGHYRLTGGVEIACPDMRLYADAVEVFTDAHRLVAEGNVVFNSATSQIGADRVEFDTRARTGRFERATGTAVVAARKPKSAFGTQEPDVYFFGALIEKLGPRTYRVTRGGFTTCVQPTPRWEIVSSSVTLTLERHAVLKHAVFKVKNVPLFYVPVMYYPLREDDRATGFLLPTYGVSTLRGQTLSNAFFWAISRSQDATVFHDWYAKTGQGVGAEYRYAAAPGSDGTARVYVLREHEAVIERGGVKTVLPARRSFEIRAAATEQLPARLRAQANVDYFSDITVLQTYYTNIYDLSRRSRSYTGVLSGTWGRSSVSGAWTISQFFYTSDYSSRYGAAPRIGFNQSQTPIGRTPLFVGVSAQYARQVYDVRSGASVSDYGLTRLDVQPVLRVPVNALPFLTWDSTIAWSATRYSESLDARGVQVPEPVWRRYFDLRSAVVGPVFVRIWNTPTNGYAERFKHILEPSVQARYVTAFDTANVVRVDASDYLTGGNLQLRYALTSRLLAKRRRGTASVSREILTATVHQTYYTDKRASQFDPAYSSSFRGRPPSDRSPLAVAITAAPTDTVSAAFAFEYDFDLPGLQSLGIRGSGRGAWVQASGGLSRRRLTYAFSLDNFVNADVVIHEPGANRFGGTYSFNYDLGRRTLLQQRVIGYYNAQCCGLAVEYQTYNYPAIDPRVRVPRDRRFNLSFTLAGIGTFSNFFGALAGTPDRR